MSNKDKDPFYIQCAWILNSKSVYSVIFFNLFEYVEYLKKNNTYGVKYA